MSDELRTRNRILNKARDHFFRHGFTKVTLDEIVQEMGVSKKTIYKFFPSKTEILRELLNWKLQEVEDGLKRIRHGGGKDFVEKLKQIYTFAALHLSEFGQPFIRDLERNAPYIWKEVEERRNRTVLATFGSVFNEGIRKGAIKRKLNPQLLLLIHTTLIQRIMNPETLSQLPMTARQTLNTIREVIFEGILTDKARTQCHAGHSKPNSRSLSR